MSSTKTAPSPAAIPPPAQTSPVNSVWKYAYWTGRTFRYIVSLSLLTIPLSFLGMFIVGGGIIRPEILQGSHVLDFMQSVCAPALQITERLFTFRTVSHGWNLLLAAMAVVTFFLRQFILMPIESLEHYLKAKVVMSAVAEAPRIDVTETGVTSAANSNRLAMLRDYTEARKVLFSEKRLLAFLSIDVVGSTKMKIGEDKLAIEHAFAEYKKFVERILKKNHIWKVAWTPDGIMCAFHSAVDAISAAQDVLRGLPWFNDGVHHLRMPFNVRCGANMGEVVFPENRAMEDISDEVIDVAGHMQKYAAHGTLWVARDMIGPEVNPEGFRLVPDKLVDGRNVMQWSAAEPDGAAQQESTAPAE